VLGEAPTCKLPSPGVPRVLRRHTDTHPLRGRRCSDPRHGDCRSGLPCLAGGHGRRVDLPGGAHRFGGRLPGRRGLCTGRRRPSFSAVQTPCPVAGVSTRRDECMTR